MDALALSRRLAALPALAMQRAALREHLEALDDASAARLCGELVRRGSGGAPYDLALLALSAILDENALGYERHEAIYAAAHALGDEPLQRLLLSAQPPPPGSPKRAPIPDRAEITLGERKSLARGSRLSRELIDRLLRDPDPAVLEILLLNPRVTEEDVVRLAARRPTSAAAQRVVFHSERFIVRYGVKRALAFNPYTPSDLAARLAPLLTKPDLISLAEDGQVREMVRQAARELLGRSPA
ncbi:MAG TPA: hypothetical protein VII38_16315 [Polyangia bacterium]